MNLLRSLWGRLINAGLAVFLVACGPAKLPLPPQQPASATSTSVNEADCKAKGGQIQRVCLMGNESCVVRYKDAGKVCTDGSQCESRFCLVSDRSPQNTDESPPPTSGTCKPTSNPCGCFTLVQDGKIGPGLCVD